MNREVGKSKMNKKDSKVESVVKHNDRIEVLSKFYNIIIDNQTYLYFTTTYFRSKQRMKIMLER